MEAAITAIRRCQSLDANGYYCSKSDAILAVKAALDALPDGEDIAEAHAAAAREMREAAARAIRDRLDDIGMQGSGDRIVAAIRALPLPGDSTP